MNRLPIALFNDRAKAEPIRQRLIASGLDVEFNDSPRLPKLWFVSSSSAGVRLEVPPKQFEKGERLLLDWNEAEGALRDAIRCPECRSLRVDYPQYARHSLLTNLAMGLLASIHLLEKDYYCEDCHFAWPKEGILARRDRPHLAPYYFIEGIEQGMGPDHPPHGADAHRKAA